MSFPDGWAVSSVRPELLAEVWPHVVEKIAKGIERASQGALTPAGIYQAVAAGDMELWLVHDGREVMAAVVLRVNARPDGHALTVVLVAGREFHRWGRHIQELIRDYAQIIGANTVQAVARPGMARWLERMGWKKKATVMELKDG